jgi:hypothetical protein
MTPESHDQSKMRHRVDILRIPLQHRLVGGDGFSISPFEQACPGRLQHAL